MDAVTVLARRLKLSTASKVPIRVSLSCPRLTCRPNACLSAHARTSACSPLRMSRILRQDPHPAPSGLRQAAARSRQPPWPPVYLGAAALGRRRPCSP